MGYAKKKKKSARASIFEHTGIREPIEFYWPNPEFPLLHKINLLLRNSDKLDNFMFSTFRLHVENSMPSST